VSQSPHPNLLPFGGCPNLLRRKLLTHELTHVLQQSGVEGVGQAQTPDEIESQDERTVEVSVWEQHSNGESPPDSAP
jgi:hypothetical protein